MSVRPIKRAAFIYRPVLEITVLLLRGYFCEITVGYLKGDLDFPEGPLTLVPNDERFMLPMFPSSLGNTSNFEFLNPMFDSSFGQ